jgi:chondroitin 4-sulfotransferase 11
VPIEFYGLLVDDERKVIYCEVPKVACSNWKRVLVYASGKTNVTDPGQLTWVDVHGKLGNTILPRLHSFSPEEIRFRLTNYFKFMFVRDPFDRVLSAYNDKFRSSDNMLFNENYGRRIIERYRQNASNESLSRGHDVKFDEFVRYLIDPATREEEQTNKHWYGFEMHWRAFDDICHPCFVGYDFLGKYETLSDDVDHALKLLGIYGQVRFPGLSAAGRVSLRTSATDRDAFLAKGYADISDEDIVGLWRLYFDDFSAFRYSYPSFANAIR